MRGFGYETPAVIRDMVRSEVDRIGHNAFSTASGLNPETVDRYKNGIGEPTTGTLKRLARYFNKTFIIKITPDEVSYR